jgi:DNA-binding NarL/FixJ family response regulator
MRVLVIADSISRSRRTAELLSEDDRLEVLSALTITQAADEEDLFADVLVTAGLSEDQIPATSLPVVALTNDVENTGWSHTVRAWLPMNASAAEITAAVMAAANRLTVLTPAQARRWLPSPNSNSLDEGVRPESLTPREQEVLRMVADGLGNKEIAARLEISDRTVKFHVTQILAKLDAASRTEAVLIGIRRGLVPL